MGRTTFNHGVCVSPQASTSQRPCTREVASFCNSVNTRQSVSARRDVCNVSFRRREGRPHGLKKAPLQLSSGAYTAASQYTNKHPPKPGEGIGYVGEAHQGGGGEGQCTNSKQAQSEACARGRGDGRGQDGLMEYLGPRPCVLAAAARLLEGCCCCVLACAGWCLLRLLMAHTAAAATLADRKQKKQGSRKARLFFRRLFNLFKVVRCKAPPCACVRFVRVCVREWCWFLRRGPLGFAASEAGGGHAAAQMWRRRPPPPGPREPSSWPSRGSRRHYPWKHAERKERPLARST